MNHLTDHKFKLYMSTSGIINRQKQ